MNKGDNDPPQQPRLPAYLSSLGPFLSQPRPAGPCITRDPDGFAGSGEQSVSLVETLSFVSRENHMHAITGCDVESVYRHVGPGNSKSCAARCLSTTLPRVGWVSSPLCDFHISTDIN